MVIRELKSENPNQVARTQVGKVVVTTIVLDHEIKALDSLLGIADGLLDRPGRLSDPGDYETMVFNCDEKGEITNWTEIYFARYPSKEEAELGHKRVVDTYSGKP